MKVIRAEAMGMCFGVRDALALTETIDQPQDVTIFGELVHNEQVNSRLERRGFITQSEAGRTVPATPAVMITAHGVSNRDRDALQAAGKRVIDTTCPLVRRAHDRALALAADGWHVVVAGKPDHVEVLGLTGDLPDFTIVPSPAEARTLPHPRIAMICQTTLPPDRAAAIFQALENANPASDVQLFDTICRPTRERQQANRRLLSDCDAVVVVGGRHSNNTLQLVRQAEAAGKPVRHISHAGELDLDWAAQFETIGLTAGTSTPPDIIDAVYDRLLTMENADQPPALAGTPAPVLPAGWVPSALWTHWYAWNAANQNPMPWEGGTAAPREKLAAVAESLQEFQRGESSEGRHFLSCGFHHAMKTGDSEYVAALDLFIQEENRHGDYLARFLKLAGYPLVSATHGDTVFRGLRRIGGLEGAITVLLTAEIIACPYYTAISRATSSPLLQAICAQILQDEYKHLRFQNERLQILQQGRGLLARWAFIGLQSALLVGAVAVLWPRHRRAIRAGGYSFAGFLRETFSVYRSQILHAPQQAATGSVVASPTA